MARNSCGRLLAWWRHPSQLTETRHAPFCHLPTFDGGEYKLMALQVWRGRDDYSNMFFSSVRLWSLMLMKAHFYHKIRRHPCALEVWRNEKDYTGCPQSPSPPLLTTPHTTFEQTKSNNWASGHFYMSIRGDFKFIASFTWCPKIVVGESPNSKTSSTELGKLVKIVYWLTHNYFLISKIFSELGKIFV